MDSVTATLNAVVLNAIKRAACDAETARKWAAVWTAHCAQEETEVQAARLLGRQLRAAKHFDIARALALGLSESDHSLAASALAVEISMRLGDTDEALRVSQELRQRFPRSPQAMRLQLDALVALSRSAEAQAVLDELPPAHRDAPWAARARAALQVAPPEAVPALEAAPEPVTVSEAALVADAQSLLSENRVDDASAMIGSCLRRYPASIAAMRVAAEIAERRGCMDEALARWADIRAAAPRSPSGYMGALRCLRRFGRLELGRPILAEGREKLWDNADFSAFAGQYTAAAKLLAEADEWLQRAVYLSPGDPHVALSAAIVLSGPRKGRKQRMPTVLARLDEHHETFPDYAPAYAAHIDALRNAGALDEADRRSTEWCARFPDDLDLAFARAGLHEEQGRFNEALQDVTALRARGHASPDLEATYIRALSCAGQHDEAERVCAAARAASPRDRRFWLEYAHLASRRGNWEQCAARLTEGLATLPKDERLVRELEIAREQLAEPQAEAESADRNANLFARFESLGGSGMGCEFGMVQRKLGSDAVGLLRWARTNPPELIAALQSDFAGVGNEEHTELNTFRRDAEREEYVTRDRRYIMESHTFVRTSDAPADRMFQQTCRRLRFLRGKLLEDLRSAGKIFVYRAQDPIDDADVAAMHAALARHGGAALLCVMRAQSEGAGGTLRQLGRGIFIGYVNYLASDGSVGIGSDIESWSAVCAKADAAWAPFRPAADDAE